MLIPEESFDDNNPKTYHHLATVYQVLSLGSRLLNMLPTESMTFLPREGSEQEPQQGVYIDEEMQTIWIWENETLAVRYLEAVARRWPGWQVQGHVEGLVRHIILSGRDPAAGKSPDQQAAQAQRHTFEGSGAMHPAHDS